MQNGLLALWAVTSVGAFLGATGSLLGHQAGDREARRAALTGVLLGGMSGLLVFGTLWVLAGWAWLLTGGVTVGQLTSLAIGLLVALFGGVLTLRRLQDRPVNPRRGAGV